MPLDYSGLLNVQRPIDRAFTGYQQGAAIQDREQAKVAAQLEQEQKQQALAAQQEQARQMQSDLAVLSQNPDAGPREYAQVMTKYPQLSAHLKTSIDLLNEDEKQVVTKQATDIFSLLQVGETDLAKETLEEFKVAAENSGDTDKARGAEALLKIIEVNPEAAKTTAGLQLFASLGEKEFASKLEQTEELKFKREELAQKKELALGKQVADARTALLAVTTAGAEKRFDQTDKLRKQFVSSAGEFVKTRDSFARVQAAGKSPTPAGDLALIFNYMKMLDPGSVVRESEFKTAETTGSIVDRGLEYFNRKFEGKRLTPKQRADFIARAGKLFDKQVSSHDKRVGEYSRLADEFKLPKSGVIVDLTDPETLKEAALAEEPVQTEVPITERPQEGAIIKNPSTGVRMVLKGGQWQPL